MHVYVFPPCSAHHRLVRSERCLKTLKRLYYSSHGRPTRAGGSHHSAGAFRVLYGALAPPAQPARSAARGLCACASRFAAPLACGAAAMAAENGGGQGTAFFVRHGESTSDDRNVFAGAYRRGAARALSAVRRAPRA